MSAAEREIRKLVPRYREGRPKSWTVTYLCGCSYESGAGRDTYHDRHCATCHRELWERVEPAYSEGSDHGI